MEARILEFIFIHNQRVDSQKAEKAVETISI